ncbi:MAG: N-acetyltransferase [Flaviaesturariibacter sp.]|nr:N-acetyltransferase [Flaviaesturariibacter sp.]
MLIQHNQSGDHGVFFIESESGERVAELTYLEKSEQMHIDHTEVDDSLRGKNIGYQLVEAAVAHARQNSLKIVPLCPFAKALIDKRPEMQDVLAKDTTG